MLLNILAVIQIIQAVLPSRAPSQFETKESATQLVAGITKIKVGLSKNEMIEALGNPSDEVQGFSLRGNYVQAFYHGDKCGDFPTCYVVLKDGRIEEFKSINSKLIEI